MTPRGFGPIHGITARMSLIFYYGSGSPFAWRVFLGLEHKGLAYEPKLLSFSAGDTRKPEFLAINPRHTVPAIVDDGFALYESAAILEYLDERFPSAPFLFPRELQARALCRRMIRELDEGFVRAMEDLSDTFYFTRPEAWDAAKIERDARRYLKELAFWEQQLTADFLLGSAPTAADFTMYPVLASARRFELRKPDLGLSSACGPRMNAWTARIEALPYFAKTYPPHWK
jgi:glutathione S-transferase